MQTSADFVATFVELASRMKHSHDDLKGADAFLLVNVYRYAAAVVLNGDGVVFSNGYLYMGAVPSEGFVY